MEDGLAIDARLQWFALAPPYGAADVATQSRLLWGECPWRACFLRYRVGARGTGVSPMPQTVCPMRAHERIYLLGHSAYLTIAT